MLLLLPLPPSLLPPLPPPPPPLPPPLLCLVQMNESVTYKLEGTLDLTALEKAANLLLDRHELLRCAFKMVDGHVMLEVQPGASIHISLLKVHLTFMLACPQHVCNVAQCHWVAPHWLQGGHAMTEDEAERLMMAESRRPFDLSRAPLMTLAVARLSDMCHALLATMHHAVFDGWSLGRVLPDLLELCYSVTQTRPSRLPKLPFQYSDFSAWEQVSGLFSAVGSGVSPRPCTDGCRPNVCRRSWTRLRMPTGPWLTTGPRSWLARPGCCSCRLTSRGQRRHRARPLLVGDFFSSLSQLHP